MKTLVTRKVAAASPVKLDGTQVVFTLMSCTNCGYVWRLRTVNARVCPVCGSTRIEVAGYDIIE